MVSWTEAMAAAVPFWSSGSRCQMSTSSNNPSFFFFPCEWLIFLKITVCICFSIRASRSFSAKGNRGVSSPPDGASPSQPRCDRASESSQGILRDHFPEKIRFLERIVLLMWASLRLLTDLLLFKQDEMASRPFSSFRDRLYYLQATEKNRVCFGKSGIHGWGLFARRNIQEGEMVIFWAGSESKWDLVLLRGRSGLTHLIWLSGHRVPGRAGATQRGRSERGALPPGRQRLLRELLFLLPFLVIRCSVLQQFDPFLVFNLHSMWFDFCSSVFLLLFVETSSCLRSAKKLSSMLRTRATSPVWLTIL